MRTFTAIFMLAASVGCVVEEAPSDFVIRETYDSDYCDSFSLLCLCTQPGDRAGYPENCSELECWYSFGGQEYYCDSDTPSDSFPPIDCGGALEEVRSDACIL